MCKRKCLECSEPLLGRKDQKFCSDYCRNAFNNRLNEDCNEVVRKVNRILRKNRRILSELLDKKQKACSLNALMEYGFNMNYHTGIYQTKKGDVYVFCYDLGYLKQENNRCVLVEKSSYLF
ncbi:MAG: hypothetical protein FJZ80_05015 [Bacteroidetes bacterium]|nr:hypothetical protein [Bacteroidota bacterium]MBM3424221.1 hypothetical protein [Bacteroidota bacterium]